MEMLATKNLRGLIKNSMLNYLKILIPILLLYMSSDIKAQVNELGAYAFGHSLLDHRPPAIPTPSDETTVFHWMADIAKASGKDFSAGGQFGFLTSHADLPPIAQWGYNEVEPTWDDQFEMFSESRINSILITPANFIQYVAATEPHPFDETTSVLELTEAIFDWTNDQKSDLRYYIYGNWPEMDLQEYYPPNLPQTTEVNAYHELTIQQGETWWPAYQDAILNSRPDYETRLIPVGLTVSKLLQSDLLDNLPFVEVYEDSAPHGRPTLYFIAAMTTYMAMFEEKVPVSYMPSNQVHSEVINNLSTVIDFIWDELNAFNLPNGDSRVFYNVISSVSFKQGELIIVSPIPTSGTLRIEGLSDEPSVHILNVLGKTVYSSTCRHSTENIDLSDVPDGIYYIQIVDRQNRLVSVKRIVKAK